ncbi:LysR family transcriptional regulator [Novosphingobium piscinae]|uniref:LysR family transcriptional regulator n=1 Tax=Novosphingobium piscinae TaxID=1507448 RepID=A0A7X1KPJ9_9SPHN|nr:LysR family transcriptional regulator [Novosphingobium piscinae]MBC2668816.1 LysR family transcriptional regulator [Novosphingobium piscinae]
MDLWELNLRHLAALARIADLGTMSAAAQAVNLTQPALTQALARIEAELGLPLFERRHDGMVPTPAADLLIPRVRAAQVHIPGPHVTMSRMRALLALADHGSYNAAALRTGLSLPSLHRAIGDLALSLRRKLVDRRGKSVVLTEAGAALARAFRLARVELEAGLAEIAALNGHETRRIVVGAMPLSRAKVLPAAVARFLRRHPLVRISIVEGSRSELVEPLRNGAIDLMVGALREPLLEPDLAQEPLFHDRPAIIARKGHPLEGTTPDLARLAAFSWVIAGDGAPLRESWAQLFRAAGLAPPPVPIESGSVMTIRQLLIDSDLLTLLSPDQVAVELEAGWLVTLGEAPPGHGRTIGMTTRASWRPTAVQAEFLDDLRAVAG